LSTAIPAIKGTFMLLHADATLDEFLASDKGQLVLKRHCPQVLADPNWGHNRYRRIRRWRSIVGNLQFTTRS
jgi:hypothetical protein